MHAFITLDNIKNPPLRAVRDGASRAGKSLAAPRARGELRAERREENKGEQYSHDKRLIDWVRSGRTENILLSSHATRTSLLGALVVFLRP